MMGDDHGVVERQPGGADPEPAAVPYRDTAAQLGIEWIKSIAIAVVMFFAIRTFLVEAYRIPTGSMENSLLTGDFLLVNKAAFGAHLPFTDVQLPAFAEPERGDIVVFVPPHVNDQNYVKRLIGAPGDTVEMRSKALYVNGLVQREPYAQYGHDPEVSSRRMDWQCDYQPVTLRVPECQPTRDTWGPVVVPPGRYLMLGDNRDDSEDSRYWGFVERSAIKGTPLMVYYSFEPDAATRMPWFTAVRWSRIGERPH